MATLYGKNHYKNYVSADKEKSATNQVHGRVRILYDEIDLSAVLAVNDEIHLGRLEKGWRVLEAVLAFPDLGGTGVGVLGYKYYNPTGDASLVDDDNAFLDAVDLNAAADTVKMSDQANMVGFMKEMEASATVVFKATTATTATSGKIKVAITYIND